MGGCITTIAEWTAGPLLKGGRDHHVTFAAMTPAGSFLFVAGGTTGSALLDSVERAAVASDGTLGDFAAVVDLPRGIAGAGLAQIDRAIVLAGGLAVEGGQSVSVTDTTVGIVGDDGEITFTAGPPVLTSRYHMTLSADRGFVYAVGGLAQSYVNGNLTQKFTDAVERATFDGTTLGAFSALAPLPLGLTHHAAVVREHVLYVIGGITGANARTDILRSKIDEAGDLGAWEDAGQLPEGRATSAAFVYEDELYVVAGATKAQGGEVATVLRASFQADGSVGSFEELTALPKARAHAHQAPVIGSTIYSAGGSINHKVQKNVYFGRLE
jgi:hypothetical protein